MVIIIAAALLITAHSQTKSCFTLSKTNKAEAKATTKSRALYFFFFCFKKQTIFFELEPIFILNVVSGKN
jgi:hypothetical protein